MALPKTLWETVGTMAKQNPAPRHEDRKAQKLIDRIEQKTLSAKTAKTAGQGTKDKKPPANQ